MPAKTKKGGRGKTVNLMEFNEDFIPDTAFDWAEDVPTTDEERGKAMLSEKIARSRQEFSRVANNTLGQQESFRTAGAAAPQTKYTIDDLQPPFVAHFGNLRNGTTEEQFLALFKPEVIVTHRLINQDGKSFAFVEFKDAQALTGALSLDQTFQRGRRMYVDLATQKQVERLLNRGTNERAGLSRESLGQQQQGGLAAMGLTRDVFGGVQSEEHPLGNPSMGGSRSNFGSRADLHDLGELSRDLIGSAVQQSSPLSASPLNGPSATANFANWRSEPQEAQPERPAMRESGRSEENLDRRATGADNWRRASSNALDSAAAAPPKSVEPKVNPFDRDGGSWRDAPRAEIPKAEEPAVEGAEATKEGNPSATNATSGRGRGGRGGARAGGARGGEANGERAAPAKSTVVENADKWAEFRR